MNLKPMKCPMSNKLEQVKGAIEAVFPGTAEAIAKGRCPCCKQPLPPLRDELSVREYEISGMCRNCQDAVFGGAE